MAKEINRLEDRHLKSLMRAGQPIKGVSDGGGLTFTLSASGTASWTFRYRLAGRGREMTLGRYPDITLKEARRIASENRAKVQQGIDVAAQKQQTLVEHREAGTINELAELWLDRAVRGKHKRPQVTERVFRRDILPVLGKRRSRDVTRPQVTRLLAKVTASGRPTIANDVLRHLKAGRGLVEGIEGPGREQRLRVSCASGVQAVSSCFTRYSLARDSGSGAWARAVFRA